MVTSVAAMALVLACSRSGEEQRATMEAEQRASQISTTSADVASRSQTDTVVVTRREQLQYRGKLAGALDDLDAKRDDARKRGGAVRVAAIDGRRELLRNDLDALDRTTDAEWGGLKVKIERDLGEGR
jgi:hypothetical protein